MLQRTTNDIYWSSTCKHIDAVFSLPHGYWTLTSNCRRVLGAAPLGIRGRLNNAFRIGLCRFCLALHLNLAEPLDKVSGGDYFGDSKREPPTPVTIIASYIWYGVPFSPCSSKALEAPTVPRPRCLFHTEGSLITRGEKCQTNRPESLGCEFIVRIVPAELGEKI